MFCCPTTRTLTPTQRTKNITPFTPAQYSGSTCRVISVYRSSGGPTIKMYSDRKMEMNAARIIGLARKTFSNQEPNVKEMLAILCGNWVGGAVQNAIANTLGTLFGVRHFGDLKSF